MISILFAAAVAVAPADVQLVSDPASVAKCERLGEVKGSSAWGGVLTNMAYNKALAQMKAKAGKLGATHVQLLNGTSGWSGSNMLGIAYRCPTEPATLAKDPAVVMTR